MRRLFCEQRRTSSMSPTSSARLCRGVEAATVTGSVSVVSGVAGTVSAGRGPGGGASPGGGGSRGAGGMAGSRTGGSSHGRRHSLRTSTITKIANMMMVGLLLLACIAGWLLVRAVYPRRAWDLGRRVGKAAGTGGAAEAWDVRRDDHDSQRREVRDCAIPMHRPDGVHDGSWADSDEAVGASNTATRRAGRGKRPRPIGAACGDEEAMTRAHAI